MASKLVAPNPILSRFHRSFWDGQSSGNTKGTVPRDFSSIKLHALFAWWGGGLRTKGLIIIRSKSNSITFYRSFGKRSQVETQKEQAKGIQISKILCIICPDWGLRTKGFKIIRSKSNAITFDRPLGSPSK